MLITRARELSATIDTLTERATQVSRVQQVESAAKRLDGHVADLQALVAWREALRQRVSAGEAWEPSSCRPALEILRGFITSIDDRGAAAVEPQAIKRAVDAVTDAAQSLRRVVTNVWVRRAAERTPVLNAQVLSVLRGIPSLRAEVSRIEDKLRCLETWGRSLPGDVRTLEEFDRTADEVRAAWERLGGNALGGDVAGFLQATGSGGAALGALTPDVLRWLEDHGVMGAFRIVLARETLGGPNRQ